MKLKEMIERQKQITDTAKAEGRGLTDAEQKEFDELQRKIDAELKRSQDGPQGSGEDSQRGQGVTPPAVGQGTTPPAAGQGESREAILQAERARVTEIEDLCRNFSIDPQEYVRGGQTIDEVRAAVIKRLQETHSPVGVRVVKDAEDKRREAVADGILMRENIHVEKPAEGASDFRGASLKDIAAACLRADGNTDMDYTMMDSNRVFDALMQRSYFNPTSSFPAIMDNVINKAYVEGHKTAPVTFDQFCSKGTLKDFKKADNYYVRGSFGEFLEVPEGGELKHTLPVDEKLPQRQLKTYGRQFTMSRQAFINDDMGVVTTLPNQAAKAARTTINTQVYRILTGNPAIYDGKKLFGADHKNLLKTGTAITREAVQTMILALGGHTKKADGVDQAILIRPAVLVVPLGYKFAMYTLFNSQTISASGDVNPLYQYRDQIRVVEDATINVLAGTNAIPWYLVGDQNDTDFIQVDYLNGQEIPNIRRMEKAGQLGFVWDVYGDWGITVMDPWGAVMNPGVKIESPLALA